MTDLATRRVIDEVVAFAELQASSVVMRMNPRHLRSGEKLGTPNR